MPEEAEFNETIEAVVRRVLASEVSTAFPATITAAPVDGLVTVQPNHKYKTAAEDTELLPEEINNVVLCYPHRTQKTMIRPPKEALIGSKVLVIACEHSLTEWRSSGGASVYPSENRQFDLNDAVAITGLYPENRAWPNPQKANTFEFLGVEGVKFAIGTQSAELLKIMYNFLEFFQTVTATDGDTLASNLTAAQSGLLLTLKNSLAKITNI